MPKGTKGPIKAMIDEDATDLPTVEASELCVIHNGAIHYLHFFYWSDLTYVLMHPQKMTHEQVDALFQAAFDPLIDEFEEFCRVHDLKPWEIIGSQAWQDNFRIQQIWSPWEEVAKKLGFVLVKTGKHHTIQSLEVLRIERVRTRETKA